ncbi:MULTISPECIES: alpha/beta hydrolase [Chryseobacterium]|uniref:Acetyl esterase/lipase n=1 Tax=Chryseobacterium camelliae TaxID=1265445 RepID=A0ABU0TFP5_9FLAO|nr:MULTISPECIES: alpha/beta hydrolase [Chryseobacterium]MDT3406313.1 acetyl esterase/lipase [Pseudacidovorax intermedius]MDQ1095888.1 acetyl esterase/lipase [Chryseobacterium camelliae]MDQ1099825.1 acetyl esterase/lipase [Chryseobacterium sp. SORGH_AS_1048]MDR6087171.1 acetyl esterase/lipase [Chryseobacterium sp. SORGH_AS_0909]MDR6131544.1 acetyl esterase/lipase [Chryseobacterium sp. SORGH_AS_1175]
MKNIVLGFFLTLSLHTMAQSIPNTEETIQVPLKNGMIDLLTGITYTQIIDQRRVTPLKMTILVPRTDRLKPAIVYFPGGGFTSADYDKFYEMKDALAKAGFVVAGAEYRVVPNLFPTLLQDAKAAVRYLKAHASELGIDPDKIGVLGDSAGGYLAQLMGTTNGEKAFDVGENLDQNSTVQSVVSLYGISNLTNIGEDFPDKIKAVHQSPAVTEALLVNGPAFGDFAGAPVQSNQKKALEASPIGHLKKNLPPFLLMHGDDDQLVSPSQSRQMYEALLKDGNTAQLITVKGAGHGSFHFYQPGIIKRVVDWYLLTLGDPVKAKKNPQKVKNSNL